MASVDPPALSADLISAPKVNPRMQNRFEDIYTVECRYNAVKYCKMLHKWLQELGKNINQMLDPQKDIP